MKPPKKCGGLSLGAGGCLPARTCSAAVSTPVTMSLIHCWPSGEANLADAWPLRSTNGILGSCPTRAFSAGTTTATPASISSAVGIRLLLLDHLYNSLNPHGEQNHSALALGDAFQIVGNYFG